MDGASSEPAVMPLDYLREITNGFSEERKLGSGSFGKVYLGVHPYGEKIAVKMLYDMPGLDEEQFQNEFKILTRLKHQNIVRLVGYCHDIQEVQVQHQGRLVLAEKTHRALCLEYMSNGSLDKYLSDECDRYDWQKGYRMIKGICQGLNYLHNEIKPPIYHLDLKPANVLLDENMIPRISDFGMSRLFGDEQTRTTKSSLGTIGYLPPEYITQNVVSSKFDIFSLGVVIIKIMAGRAGYFNIADMSSQEFTMLVQENWTNRLLVTSNRRNAYSEQVKICIEIGLSCVQEDRHKRPTIQDIVDRLKETEIKCNYASRKDWLLIFQEANRKTFPQYAQDPNDRHSKQRYHGSTFNQSDVGTFFAVDCTPVDDNGRQGEFGMKFANSGNKITCGAIIEPAKCRLMSVDEKRELVRELSKRPHSAPDKLQSWSRRDIVEILCADLGRERKYTGLSKQRMLDYLFRVVTGKSSAPVVHVQEKEPTPDPNTSNHQYPAKRQRKSDTPSRLSILVSNPLTAVVPVPVNNVRSCLNSACRAILHPQDKFCRRCSCCICFKYDDNKDPSLWLFCSSENPMQKDSCGFSCHLECALKDARTGILPSGQCKKLDGAYYCTHCRKQHDLLRSWKKQLVIAKDARRLDVLCYRIFLSHKVLFSTEKYLVLHKIVDTAMKKLEAEVGSIAGFGNMGRGIVSRLTCGAEVQKLCARALDVMESMYPVGSPTNSQFQRSNMMPLSFIKFEPITPTSITVVFDLDQCPSLAQGVTVTGFKLWHQVAGTGPFSANPTGIMYATSKTFVVAELMPATSYMFKITAFNNSSEFGLWEDIVSTSSPKEKLLQGSVPGGAGVDQNNRSPKTNSGGQSDRSSEGVDSNNNATVYTDLNKSPESDFEYCENPEILDSDKACHHPEPANNSQNMQIVEARVPEVTELEEATGLSALDEEPNSTVQTAVLRESSNSIEQNQRTEVPISQDASNATAGDELALIPRFSGSMPPTAPRVMETGKETGGRSFNTKPSDNIFQNGSSKPEREPGNSSNKRSGKFEDAGHKDGTPEASYEYCVRVVRWLECEGYIETNFRVKFLTWYSLRATPHDRKIVSVYVDTLIDDPVSLCGQLTDTFSEAIYSKKPPSVPSGFCMDLWH